MRGKRTLPIATTRIAVACIACCLSACGTTSSGSSSKAEDSDGAGRGQLKDFGRLALQVNPGEQIESIVLLKPDLLEVTLRGPEGVRKVQFTRVKKDAPSADPSEP
jgi:hypothetical protein